MSRKSFQKTSCFCKMQLFTAAQADEQCQEPKLIAHQMKKNVFLKNIRSHFNRLSKSQEEENKLGSPF